MTKIDIRRATAADAAAILKVYKAAGDSGGLARRGAEIEPRHVDYYLANALPTGLCVVAEIDGALVGEMHAWPMEPLQFAHVLSDLTIAVHPDAQGQGVGRRMFTAFIAEVRAALPQIRRVELGCRETNARAVALYEAMGFVVEGRLKSRVYDPGGFYEDDLMMGLWLDRP